MPVAPHPEGEEGGAPYRGHAIVNAANHEHWAHPFLLFAGSLAVLAAYMTLALLVTPGSSFLQAPALNLDTSAGTRPAELLRHHQPLVPAETHRSSPEGQKARAGGEQGPSQAFNPSTWGVPLSPSHATAPLPVPVPLPWGPAESPPAALLNEDPAQHATSLLAAPLGEVSKEANTSRAAPGDVARDGAVPANEPSSSSSRRFQPGYFEVPITVLNDSQGDPQATCLDGSPPAYHMSAGWGKGSTRWIVFLEGGSWCPDRNLCRKRAATALGSSELMSRSVAFQGILANDSSANPNFFDWNIVYIRYCSGASFSSNATVMMGSNQLRMMGRRVFDRVVRVLLQERGMRSATHVLLAGCSAGGLAALLNCDHFHAMMRSASKMKPAGAGAKGPLGRGRFSSVGAPVVKCLSDGGFFLDTRNVLDQWAFRPVFNAVLSLHRPVLSDRCLKAHKQSWQARSVNSTCYFAEKLLPYVDTPWFIFNALYDMNIIPNYYVFRRSRSYRLWRPCSQDLRRCAPWQMKKLHGYRREMINKVLQNLKTGNMRAGAGQRPLDGAYLSSCYGHCQSHVPKRWHGPKAQRIEGKTPSDLVGDWFFLRSLNLTFIDRAFGQNPTC